MKKIKFDLPIDGQKARSIEELQEHFTTEIIGHFRSGVLRRWLESRDDSKFLPEVEKLEGSTEAQSDDALALRELCRIFEVDADEAAIEAAVAKSTGVPGRHMHSRMQKELLDGLLAATHHLSRLVSPRSEIQDFRRAHFGFDLSLPDASASTDPDEWSVYVVEFINHCQVVVDVLEKWADRMLADALAAHASDHVDCVLDCFDGMTREEFDGVATEAHVEDVRPPIRMEPVRHDAWIPGRTRISDLQWLSEGVIANAGDVDWWCFTVVRRGVVTVETNGDLRTVGVLEDCSGGRIERDNESGGDRNFKIVHTLDPGTYYIRVSAFGTATGSYTLNVRHTTWSAGTDRGGGPEPLAASLAVNHSISRARAIAGRHRQEVLRNLSKEHLRALGGIVGDPAMSDARWIRAWPIIQRYLKEGARAAGNAADGDSTDEPSTRGAIGGMAAPLAALGLASALTGSSTEFGHPTQLRLTDEEQAALEAFAHALRENGKRMARRIGDAGMPASGTDTAMHDEA